MRRTLGILSVAVVWASLVVPGPLEAKGLRTIAFLRPRDFAAPHPDGLLLYLERSLDGTSLRYAPAPLSPDVREGLASAIAAFGDSGRERTSRSYIRREAAILGIEGILLLRAREEGSKIAFSLLGSGAPFDGAWSVRARPSPPDSAWEALRTLADSAAARFGTPPRSREPLPTATSLEAEDFFARGTETGSLDLLAKAAAIADHEAARSDLGFRLFQRGCRGKGFTLLENVDEQVLSDHERLLHRARAARVSGAREDFERAVKDLKEAYPDRHETLLLEGLSLLGKGDLERARGLFERAIRAGPADPLAHLLLAETALRDGHLGAAREEYRRVLLLDPHDSLAPIGLASVLYSEGSLAEAEALLSDPPPGNPHGPEGTRPRFLHEAARAGLYVAEGRFVAAKNVLARARDEAYRLGDEESLVDLTIRRFHALLEQGEADSAGTELSEVRFRGSAPFLRAEKTGAVAALEGLLGAHRHDYGAVIAKRLELETIPGADPAERDAFEGLYYILQGSTWEAKLPLRRALRAQGSSRIRHLLGRASLGAPGQSASAIDELEWVADRGEFLLDSPPVLAVNFYYLGRAFEERGERSQAELAYREFLHYREHADAGSPETTHAKGYLHGTEESPPADR